MPVPCSKPSRDFPSHLDKLPKPSLCQSLPARGLGSLCLIPHPSYLTLGGSSSHTGSMLFLTPATLPPQHFSFCSVLSSPPRYRSSQRSLISFSFLQKLYLLREAYLATLRETEHSPSLLFLFQITYHSLTSITYLPFLCLSPEHSGISA